MKSTHAIALSVTILLSPGIVGCGNETPQGTQDGPPTHTFPEGTVLAVDQHPITAAEVDRYVAALEIIESEFTLTSHRRKILSNITLPIAAGAALDPTTREEAFVEAQSLLAAARESGSVPEGAGQPQTLTGTFKVIGLASWAIARETEPMAFSDLHETPGSWTFFRLIAVPPEGEKDSPTSQYTIVRYDVPYLPFEDARDLIQMALDEFEITVVDPAWDAAVPPIYLYKSGIKR